MITMVKNSEEIRQIDKGWLVDNSNYCIVERVIGFGWYNRYLRYYWLS